MKKVLLTTALVSLIIGATSISSMASSAPCSMSQMKGEETGNMMGAGMMGPGMMGPSMMGPGMMGPGMINPDMMRSGRMGAGIMRMGMMDRQMAHVFYLDQADELGLSADQAAKLKALQSDSRRDNIRNAAEVKIARMELADLLDSDNWSMKDAETLTLKAQKLESDIQVRHLQAMSDARKVLNAEQLKLASSAADSDSRNLECLFK